MSEIIARRKEQDDLKRLYEDKHPEFTVVYGRRRVGKTFLIRQFFRDNFAFFHTALSPYEDISPEQLNKQQLINFQVSLVKYGDDNTLPPASWIEAFSRLEALLEKKADGTRMVVFLDELPWLDVQKSGFIPAFEHFWNSWGSSRDDFMLIVCGSATSWIMENLMNNKGGLYGRVTSEIHLHPMTVAECSEFLTYRNIEFSLYDIIQCYMILGGIPYYMNMLRKDLSLAANIDLLFFNKDSRLANEFDRLMGSLFKHPENYIKAVRLLSGRRIGYTRGEIASETGIKSGGGLTTILKALEESDFITSYRPLISNTRKMRYRLTDNFILFYLKFSDGKKAKGDGYWSRFENTSELKSWRGLAFENLCFNHIPQIKNALGISGVYTETSCCIFSGNDGNRGAQIDLLIDRDDRIMNLCELKFSETEYVIDKDEEEKLRNRKQRLYEESKTKKAIHLTLITTYALKQNKYSGIVQNVITAEQLMSV